MWLVTVVYKTGSPSVLKFSELERALAFAKDACQWMEISKASKVTIELGEI